MPVAGLRSPVCPYHQLVHLDTSGQWQVNADCVPPDQVQNQSWFVLPPAMEFYYKTKNYQYHMLPPYRVDCSFAEKTTQMEMIYPKDGAKIYIPIQADGQRGRIIYTVAHRKPGSKVFWHLDDQYIGATRDYHQVALDGTAGPHQLTLVDEEGNTLSLKFTLLDKHH